ncbi:MAG: 2-oxoacid:acceptor oxidoreductase subunit alpha, partial [Muribaculaceae bacterium]|nr:2-oxoacid:acceptor oxidoreductase subunit alpha [Muribaculaceae bacterium]
IETRRRKVARIACDIPAQEVIEAGVPTDTLLVGWGGTYGHLRTAAAELTAEGVPVDLVQLRYINPLPANMGEIFARYKRVIVAELNTGMLADYLQSRFPEAHIERINKVQGQPFMVEEVAEAVKRIINS